jgi:hypothetical protein
MPKSSPSYITQLPSSPSGLLREDGIEAGRVMKTGILQTPLRILALSRFLIHHSSFALLPAPLFCSTQTIEALAT